METIRLPQGIWHYDPNQPLGPKGGFGIVYLGTSQEFGDLAVKKIFVEAQDAVHRELRITDELKRENFQHIIPFYDSGQDAETGINYVVMARAEKSLQQELNSGKKFTEGETVEILLQIAKGLYEVPELVHRDLKPGNVLFHQGKWKVADFGIAKFVEESTSLQTLNDCLSPQYAAPEQWEYHHPTHAVDVYALGCIGYALITGRPPFAGTIEDLKQQHLQSEPPILNIENARLRSLLSIILRKIPETRPSLERVKNLLEQILTSISQPESGGFSALSDVAAVISDQSAKEDALRRAEQNEQISREKIAHEALQILNQIIDSLFEKIYIFAPNAEVPPGYPRHSRHSRYPDRMISLGTAKLQVIFPQFTIVPKDAFKQSQWKVFAGAIIKVKQETRERYEWGANLWFTDLGKNTEFRWWEVTYMTSSISRHPDFQPYAVDDLSIADRAASRVMDIVQFGAKPKLVDDEAADEFCDRWAGLLAKAAKGELQHPSRLPLD